ncbi:MAG TPA: DMT family transporter [Croceibacterium sp.]|jgi:drug/metabolite transporter (DMT)-like permease
MQQSDRAGLAYALAGFCTLSIGDAIVKGMAGLWPATVMAATRYFVGASVLAALLARAEGVAALRLPRDPIQWVRGIAISCSALGMFFAVWLMPLATATTIQFTQPMITAMLAVLLLGERARPSTLVATLAAFAGVFLALRPNFATAGWGVLFPVMGASGMAVTIIANRVAVGRASNLALQYYMSVTAMIFLILTTVVMHFWGPAKFHVHPTDWTVIARCALIGITATLAQWLIFMGTVKAGAATISPMTYGQLLMATMFGYFFYGDTPDALSFLGAAIIIGAGLYLWWAGRVREPAKTEL